MDIIKRKHWNMEGIHETYFQVYDNKGYPVTAGDTEQEAQENYKHYLKVNE